MLYTKKVILIWRKEDEYSSHPITTSNGSNASLWLTYFLSVFIRWILISYSLFIMEVLDIAKEKDMPVNEQIRVRQMLVIGPNGEQLGIKSKEEALTLASYAGFDLVLINDKGENPVCKLMDYNKFKYEKKKKLKESQKRQKENNAETKEYRLSPNIDVHDFNTKLNNAKKYLEKGHKIKLTIRFRGREMQFTDKGRDVLLKFAESLSDVGALESAPMLDGRNMMAMISPVKNK